MTTLADMTPAQRYDCVGMWATVSNEHYPAVIVRIYGGNPDVAQMLAPEIDDYYASRLESITPRFDLPRAWNPDGTPMTGEQETLITQPHPRGSWNSNPEYPEYFQVPPGTTMRRWISEWKEV